MTWSKLIRTATTVVAAIPLDTARAHLRVEHTDEDAYIESLIEAATATIEGPHGIGVALVSQTWAMTFDGFLPSPFALPLYPVQSVTSITYTDTDGQTQTLDPSLYQFAKGNPAVVERAPGASWPAVRRQLNAATATFAVGFGASAADVPADLRHAILLMVGHLYEQREAVGTPKAETPLGFAALTERYRVGRFG